MSESIQSIVNTLYADASGAEDRLRWLLDTFESNYGSQPTHFVSTPGRTEIGGNHTDHNNGKVIAAAINLDAIGWYRGTDDDRVTIYSDGYIEPFSLSLTGLDRRDAEATSTDALIRGVAARLSELDYEIGGFQASIASNVLIGSGLSSSASIEVLLGTIFNQLYNANMISPEILAKVGQYAENNYYGKPCGLMDQTACAVGGIIAIDFENTDSPKISKIEFDLDSVDYRLVIVNSGGSHADLTSDYAAIPAEMQSVAELLGKSTLREIDQDQFYEKIPTIQEKLGDRPIMRAIHYFEENMRVDEIVNVLNEGNFSDFLYLIKDSGNSSYKWLQNIYSHKSGTDQRVALALALTERFINQHGLGATRVHGGGFAGTVQVFMPRALCSDYSAWMSKYLDAESIVELEIRQIGTWTAPWDGS